MASSRRLRALITNDDGIDSPGLWALADATRDAGFDVVVAAPHRDASGVGASVFAVRGEDGVAVHPRELPGLDGVPAYAVEGHPSFIVYASGRGWLEPKPDLVVSGINLGANVGRSVLHSGTVGAALTAGLQGWYGLAVSLDTGWTPPEHPHWEAATAGLPEVFDLLLSRDPGTVLSYNAPDVDPAALRELREAELAEFGTAQVVVEHREAGPGGATHGTLRSSLHEVGEQPSPTSDVGLLAAGHPTVTELRSVAAVPGVLGGVVVTSAH
ncbi:5'/3'-nucleotidase SurE [Pseudonocardia benzenivorans]|uniref:5'-nucleotidase n=2 Tax=Pseudonocardia TaxID=1847 RepID=F4CLX2_PSEUX|nr:5'/3'-nucleotidase SurE [Pseudonocardia dioxanivorans]AEA28254.1 Survival protein SurE [Pseudonocardia dioxanivorans CB1190]GJF02828.1 5'/3'-nucleotidase SurE [Pseudonocardia sp. D17]